MHKPDIHPAMRIRREPSAPVTPDAIRPVKSVIPVNLDMPTETVKSDGRQIVRPVRDDSDTSDNPLKGLDECIRDLGGKVVRMGTICAIDLDSRDPAHVWQKAGNGDKLDIPGAMARDEVTQRVEWSILPNSDKVLKRPNRLTYAQLAQTDPIHAKRAEMRKYRKTANVARTGQGGTKPMSADIPRNLDTNDASADVAREDTKRAGSRILVNESNSVHSDGKWTTRMRSVYSDTPGKGHILVKSVIGWQVVQFGQDRTLADFVGVEIGHLVHTATFAPYEVNFLGKIKRGEATLSDKLLNLDGTNPRVQAAAKAARAAKAAKRAKSGKLTAAERKAARVSELAALAEMADKVHNGQKAPFAPMTRAEREINGQIG